MNEKFDGTPSVDNVEKPTKHEDSSELDEHGVAPPQTRPSHDKNDPLNWPYWLKVYLAVMVSGMGFANQLGSAIINPTLVLIAEDLHVSVVKASYTATVTILFMGVTPMFVVPFSNVYGRRVLYLIFTAIAVACQFGGGAAATYGGLFTARVFYGIGASIPLGIGAATICDLFPQGQRGKYLGMYTLCVNNGPHLAPIIGGYIALNLSWRWCLYVAGFIQAGLLAMLCLTFPETLYSRTDGTTTKDISYVSRLFPRGKILNRPLKPRHFLQPYIMIKYWAISLPSIYWMTANTWGSTQFAVTGSQLARQLYGFNVAQTGLLMGIPQTVGCMVGEATAGWVSDMIINSYARRHNGYRKPEVRLALLPGCAALVVGVITYGVCVNDHKSWPSLAITMGVASFGLQVGATMVYTYATDCYEPQAPEVGVVINLFKSSMVLFLLAHIPVQERC